MNLTLSENTQDKLGLIFGLLMMGVCLVAIPLFYNAMGGYFYV